MMPMKPIGPPTETAAPVASDALKNARRCALVTREAARFGAVGAQAEQVQRPRQPGKDGERHEQQRQRREDRLIAADVEVAHQPAQRPVGVGEVGEVLHAEDQRGEERVERHAGEQQDVGREAAMLRARQRVDDRRPRTAAPAKPAAGTAEIPAMPSVQLKVIASIAPSAAPDETPSVNGVASGLRSSP